MRARHRLRQLVEEGFLNLGKFCGIHHLEDVLHLIQEHDFFCTVDLWPITKKPKNNLHFVHMLVIFRYFPGSRSKYYLFGQSRVLLQELDNAVSQLRMIHAEALHFVEWNQDPRQKQFVFLLQRQRETINNGSQDFQQFCNSIKAFGLIYELEEHVVNRATDIRP